MPPLILPAESSRLEYQDWIRTKYSEQFRQWVPSTLSMGTGDPGASTAGSIISMASIENAERDALDGKDEIITEYAAQAQELTTADAVDDAEMTRADSLGWWGWLKVHMIKFFLLLTRCIFGSSLIVLSKRTRHTQARLYAL